MGFGGRGSGIEKFPKQGRRAEQIVASEQEKARAAISASISSLQEYVTTLKELNDDEPDEEEKALNQEVIEGIEQNIKDLQDEFSSIL